MASDLAVREVGKKMNGSTDGQDETSGIRAWTGGNATLDALQDSVRRLEAKVQEDASVIRVAQLSVAELAGQVKEFRATLAALEAAVARPPVGEVPGLGTALQEALKRGWARAWAAGLRIAERADQTALLASRRILLGHANAEVGPAAVARAVVGASLFVAALEVIYEAQIEARKRMTRRALQATRPLALGITALRNVTWAAAIIVGAIQLRHSCHSAAGSLVSAAEKATGGLPNLSELPELPAWLRKYLPGPPPADGKANQ